MYVMAACLVLLSALCTVGAVRVTGVLSGGVTLPCRVSPDLREDGRRSNYSPVYVEWKKFGRPVVRVASSGVTYTGQSVISRVLVPLPSIDHGEFSLQLKNVREKDAGIYRGIARYGNRKKQCIIALTVLKIAQSPLGVMPENGAVTFTCAAVGPEGSQGFFRWRHRGVRITPSHRIILTANSLHIRRLSKDDEGEWSCETDGVQASMMLHVLGIAGPPFLSVFASSGSQTVLPCKVTADPAMWPLSVQWSKSNVLIGESGPTLPLSYVTPADAGMYQCDITYRNQTMTRVIILKVIQVFPPGPTFAREGSPFQLVCNVTGAGEGEKYEWTGPANSSEQHPIRNGSILKLPSISKQDSGTWVCSVYGKSGFLGQAEHWLYVHAPQISELSSFSSWQIYVILLLSLVLLLGLVAIAVVSFHNRRRRLSHLAALTTLSAPSPKNVPE